MNKRAPGETVTPRSRKYRRVCATSFVHHDDHQWRDFAAYLPRHPDTYFDLAEDLWCDEDISPTGREWVADAILRWLGMWHTDWHLMEVKQQAALRWVNAVNADGSYGRWFYAMACRPLPCSASAQQ